MILSAWNCILFIWTHAEVWADIWVTLYADDVILRKDIPLKKRFFVTVLSWFFLPTNLWLKLEQSNVCQKAGYLNSIRFHLSLQFLSLSPHVLLPEEVLAFHSLRLCCFSEPRLHNHSDWMKGNQWFSHRSCRFIFPDNSFSRFA